MTIYERNHEIMALEELKKLLLESQSYLLASTMHQGFLGDDIATLAFYRVSDALRLLTDFIDDKRGVNL